jgi:hypothetical protein
MPRPSISAHHGDPGDPELLDWLQHRFDSLVGLDPLAIILLILLVLIAIPIAILAVYALQRRHSATKP